MMPWTRIWCSWSLLERWVVDTFGASMAYSLVSKCIKFLLRVTVPGCCQVDFASDAGQVGGVKASTTTTQ